MPGSYSGGIEIINPVDDSIIWNPTLQMWQVSVNITGFSGFFVASEPETVLPLKLVSLSAEKSGTYALITWTSANETGLEHFEIQKSINGINFEKIATIKALNAGNAESRSRVADKSPRESVCYYRLKILEKNGSVDYSKVVALRLSLTQGELKISPNPAVNYTIISHPIIDHADATTEIISSAGKLVKTIQMTVGTTQKKINMQALCCPEIACHSKKLNYGNESKKKAPAPRPQWRLV